MSIPLTEQSESLELWSSMLAAEADFPDERLNTRFVLIMQALTCKPKDPFCQACQTPAEAKGLYRFLENKRIVVDDVRQPLVNATVEMLRGTPTVLAIQDSSSANYANLKHTVGLGKLNDSDALGLHFHTTIAVQPDGVVRGLLHQSHWSREVDAEPTAPNRNDRPIEDKESYKWLDGIEHAEAAVDALPIDQRPRLIHIFDREGDIHEALQRISDSPHGAVIRVAQTARQVDTPEGNVLDTIAAQPCLGTHRIDVPAKHGAKKRQAKLQLRLATVTITPNTQRHPGRQPVTWTLIEAREVDAPEGVEPLCWLLWTTEPAQTVAEVVEVLRLYSLRWLIEDLS